MKKIFLIALFLLTGAAPAAYSQILSADIGVNGLTCSMCARGTEETLKRLDFIDTMWVDLNALVAHVRIKQGVDAPVEELVKGVEDAGFSVRNIVAIINFTGQKISDGGHVTIGHDVLNFMGTSDQTLTGPMQVRFIDKAFVSKKEFREWSQKTEMKCYKDNKIHDCCPQDISDAKRMFHVTLVPSKS